MKKVIHKWIWAWNFDKEEKWLNEMAVKGLCLSGVSLGRYEFEECLPGEYSIRLELLEHRPNHAQSERYITFIEETGAQHVGSLMRWVYFKKKTADGPFDLFSDNSSRISHLNRILLILSIAFAYNLYIGYYNLYLFFSMNSNINIVGVINIFLGLFLLYGFYKLDRKKHKLKKEQQIFE